VPHPNLYLDFVVPHLSPAERAAGLGADWSAHQMLAFASERSGRAFAVYADGRVTAGPDADPWARVIEHGARRDLFYLDILRPFLSPAESHQRLGLDWPLCDQLQLLSDRTGLHWYLRADGRVGARHLPVS
jgi:hypothetical protein